MKEIITGVEKGYEEGEETKYHILRRATSSQIYLSDEASEHPLDFTTLEIEKDVLSDDYYPSALITGKIERMYSPIIENITEIINEAVNIIYNVLEAFDEEMERLSTFALIRNKIKKLWDLRKNTNQNFTDVLVLLNVVSKNSLCKNYSREQYKTIRIVLEKIRSVNITDEQAKECRKLLKDNDLDIYSPLRNIGKYTIKLEKTDEIK